MVHCTKLSLSRNAMDGDGEIDRTGLLDGLCSSSCLFKAIKIMENNVRNSDLAAFC